MNRFTVFIFRLLLIAGGIILIYIIGKPVAEAFKYRINGNVVVGKVIGFRGGGSSKTIFEENTGKRNNKRKSRRPVYRYPIKSGSLDSIEGFSKSTIILPWLNFELGEEVSVVMDSSDSSKSHIFSLGIFFTDMLLILLSLYMIKLGFYRPNK